MPSALQEQLSCTICQHIFRDPVFLGCSHSFCKSCLKKWWRNRKPSRRCPVCKVPSESKHPQYNLVLRKTCEAFLRERAQEAAVGSEDLCSVHSEKFKLFCVDHQQLVCLICRESASHENHRFIPINETAKDCRKELQESLGPIKERLKLFNQVKGKCDQTAEHVRIQARRTQAEIREQFEKLHQFLRNEEQARISALKEEEEQKSEIMKEKTETLSGAITVLSDTVGATEKTLRASDASFLQSRKAAAEKVQQCPLPEAPQPVSGPLIDEAKHLGNLTFNIWNKMKEMVSYTSVILDPNTAQAGLHLSGDLTSMRYGQNQQLPGNPERFWRGGMILASKGFNSGTHRWAVEVGDNDLWIVGVATQTFNQSGKTDLKSGLFAIGLYKDKYVIIFPQKVIAPLRPKRTLKAIRVHLDWEGGSVSFFDAETNTQLVSLTHPRTETLFPFFCTTRQPPLKILPLVDDENGEKSGDDGAQAVKMEDGGNNIKSGDDGAQAVKMEDGGNNIKSGDDGAQAVKMEDGGNNIDVDDSDVKMEKKLNKCF